MLHRLHSYTLTSGAPVLSGIVRATLIGPEQFGHIGGWGFILQTYWAPLTPQRGNTRRTERFRHFNRREKYGIKVGVPVQSPTKFELVIDLKTGDRAEVG
jgi:hypothetical protein